MCVFMCVFMWGGGEGEKGKRGDGGGERGGGGGDGGMYGVGEGEVPDLTAGKRMVEFKLEHVP